MSSVYHGSDLWIDEKLPAWQRSLSEMLEKDPAHCPMIWVCDPVGGTGKTKYMKTQSFRHDAVELGYLQTKDLLKAVTTLGARRLNFFDHTRPQPERIDEVDLYAGIESVKGPSAHVIVFSKSLPDPEHVTVKEWDVFTIQNDSLVKQRHAVALQPPRSFRYSRQEVVAASYVPKAELGAYWDKL